MNKPKAIFLCNYNSKVQDVYGTAGIERIRQNADISDVVVTEEELRKGGYEDCVEIQGETTA